MKVQSSSLQCGELNFTMFPRTFFTRHGNSLILSDFVLNTPPNPCHFPECFSYIFRTTSKFPNLDYIRSKYEFLTPFIFPHFFRTFFTRHPNSPILTIFALNRDFLTLFIFTNIFRTFFTRHGFIAKLIIFDLANKKKI